MKKLTALALLLCAVAWMAYAGPYFTIEQNPLLPEAEVVVGIDFVAKYIDMSNFSIAGDFYVMNDNLWAYPTPWIGGFELEGWWINDGFARILAIEFGMEVATTPLPWPAYVELDNWTTSLAIFGYPSSVMTVWVGVDLVYDVTNPPGPVGWVGIWDFTPVVGIECHW